MAMSAIYSKVNTLKIGDNEPVFTIRTQDKLVEASIGIYKLLAAALGSKKVDDPDQEIN